MNDYTHIARNAHLAANGEWGGGHLKIQKFSPWKNGFVVFTKTLEGVHRSSPTTLKKIPTQKRTNGDDKTKTKIRKKAKKKIYAWKKYDFIVSYEKAEDQQKWENDMEYPISASVTGKIVFQLILSKYSCVLSINFSTLSIIYNGFESENWMKKLTGNGGGQSHVDISRDISVPHFFTV